jgi:hypothetical protein
MTTRTTSPRGVRARELGSGTVGTSVMVTVVVVPKVVFVNVPGLVKLGTDGGPCPNTIVSEVRATKHGPNWPLGPPRGQPVELPLSWNSIIGPKKEVAVVKVVVVTTSWKLGKANITSRLLREVDVTW